MRRKLRLVSTTKFKKDIEYVLLYAMDDQSYCFELDKWDMYTDDEWIDMVHKGKKQVESFNTANILRISFFTEQAKLKSVPPLKNRPGA